VFVIGDVNHDHNERARCSHAPDFSDSGASLRRCFPERPFGSTFRAAATNSSNSSGSGELEGSACDFGPLDPFVDTLLPSRCVSTLGVQRRSNS